MLYKTRKKLFWSLVALFLIVGSILVVYSFGYRLDAKALKFVQTGGLYFKTEPKTADIFVDGKIIERRTGLLTTDSFVQGLPPGAHQVEVKKDGYFSWTKEAMVNSKLVGGFTHIILLAQKPAQNIFYEVKEGETIVDFSETTAGQFLLESKIKDKFGVWQKIQLINANNSQAQEIFKKKITINQKLNLIKDIFLNSDDSQVIISFPINNSSKTFYLWNKNEAINPTDLSKILKNYFPSAIENIRFHPFNEGQFIIRTAGRLAIFDLAKSLQERGEAVYLPTEKIIDFAVAGAQVFWLEKVGAVYSYNLISKSVSLLGEFKENNISDSKIFISPDSQELSLLTSKGELFLISAGNVKLLSSDIKLARFSPDSRKLAYLKKMTDGLLEARVYFLQDLIQDIEKKKGEEIFWAVNLAENKIADFDWHQDSFHLMIATTDGQIQFAEIDDRGQKNIISQQFEIGGFIIDKAGLIFHINPSIVEKINLLVEDVVDNLK